MIAEIEYLDSLQGSGIRPGLARMRKLLRAAGSPHRAVPAVIVAGTNGKGSTAATLASILSAAGYATGLYTSPHLVDLRERWSICGEPVTADELTSSVRLLRDVSRDSGITPTYFEALTVIAFFLFHARRCDVSVLEVGMGGRLDATNVVRPVAAVISQIGFDHTEYLGETLPAIAREKAGVIHRGAVALTSNSEPSVLTVLRRRASRFDVPLHVVGDEVAIRDRRHDRTRQVFTLDTPRDTYLLVSPLLGEHQLENVALAVRAAEELRQRFTAIDRGSIEQGVARTRWRGRLERFTIGTRHVWVDGAHNPAGAARLASFVAGLPRPRLLVFGMLSDKNIRETAGELVSHFDRVIFTEPPGTDRAASAELLRDLTGVSGEVIPAARLAFDKALSASERSVVICGSLYLAGAAVAFFDEAAGGENTDENERQ